jgi:drug/metabolite transporter (DMT)-like permease
VKKFYIIGFAILLFFDTLTQTSFKLAALGAEPPDVSIAWVLRLIEQPWLYVAVLAYLGAFITYMTVLKHAPVGPAYAATHLEIVTVLFVSAIFLGEHLSLLQVGGAVLILAGIACLGTEKEEPKPIPEPLPERQPVEHVV